MLYFNIHNVLKLLVEGNIRDELRSDFIREYRYFLSHHSEAVILDVVISICKNIKHPDEKLFPYYGKNKDKFYFEVYNNPCYFYWKKNVLNFEISCDMNVDQILYSIIEPILLLKLHQNNMTFLHASSLSINNEGVLFAAWPHTGKTNSLLYLLNSLDLENTLYFSDELCIVSSNGNVYPYPRSIKIFNYNLEKNEWLMDTLRWSVYQKIIYFSKNALLKIIKFMSTYLKRSNKIMFMLRYFTSCLSMPIMVTNKDVNIHIGKKTKINKIIILEKNSIIKEVVVKKVINNELLINKLLAGLYWERMSLFQNYFAYLYLFNDQQLLIENVFSTSRNIINDAIKTSSCYQIIFPSHMDVKDVLKKVNL